MKSFFVKLFDRLLCTALALVMVQFPLYFQQYMSTLAGAHGEARHLYQDVEGRAKKLHLSTEVFVQQHLEADNALFQQTGEALESLIKRYKKHEAALKTLSECKFWKKPFLFALHYEPSIQAATRFSPGLPMTKEALAYGIVGILLGLGIIQLIKLTCRFFIGLLCRLFRLKPALPAS